MTELARKTHLNRQNLYSILSKKGNPRLDAFGIVLKGLGFKLTIRPLRKLADESVLQGEAERRTGVYTSVHEDSSTASTQQDASSVEFPKRSIEI